MNHTVDNIFTNRPMMADYPTLPADVRELVDYTIKESIRPNPALRVPKGRLFGRTYTSPVNPKAESLWKLSWGDLIQVRMALQENDLLEIMRLMYGITARTFAMLDLFNVFACYRWVTNELIEIGKIEVQELASELTSDEKLAGADELQRFGVDLAIDALTQGDMTKEDAYLAMDYDRIFKKMCMNKVRGDVNKRLAEIKTPKPAQ